MTVKSARFIKSIADGNAESFSPQVCVAGRSNCGKSSLLNMLMNAKLCKTSQTPGRTQLINLFEVEADERFYFIDLTGSGFNAAQKSRADAWSTRIDEYFRTCTKIAQVLCLMDIRRDPSDLDKTLINYLRDLELPFTVILTKSDKLKRSQQYNAKMKIAAALGLARDNLIVTSSLDRSGRDELLTRIEEVIDNS